MRSPSGRASSRTRGDARWRSHDVRRQLLDAPVGRAGLDEVRRARLSLAREARRPADDQDALALEARADVGRRARARPLTRLFTVGRSTPVAWRSTCTPSSSARRISTRTPRRR